MLPAGELRENAIQAYGEGKISLLLNDGKLELKEAFSPLKLKTPALTDSLGPKTASRTAGEIDPEVERGVEKQMLLHGLADESGAVAEEDYEMIMGGSSGVVQKLGGNAGGGGGDSDDGMSVVDGATPTRGKKPLPPPRQTLDRGCKSAPKADAKVKDDIQVKAEPKVKAESQAGDKRKPGGQFGPRGNYKKIKAALPPVLKGSDAPTVNLISPSKGALACSSMLCSAIEFSLRFQCVRVLPPCATPILLADSFMCIHPPPFSLV